MENNIRIGFIEKDEILITIPFVALLNENVEIEVLEKRMLEMVEQNYACLGVYDNDELIGICGLWFMTRHYSGKCIEPDHVVIDESQRGMGIGKILFDWIEEYAKQNSYESLELNTYVRNTPSHKFYYNLGYEIMGYHFVKKLD